MSTYSDIKSKGNSNPRNNDTDNTMYLQYKKMSLNPISNLEH